MNSDNIEKGYLSGLISSLANVIKDTAHKKYDPTCKVHKMIQDLDTDLDILRKACEEEGLVVTIVIDKQADEADETQSYRLSLHHVLPKADNQTTEYWQTWIINRFPDHEGNISAKSHYGIVQQTRSHTNAQEDPVNQTAPVCNDTDVIDATPEETGKRLSEGVLNFLVDTLNKQQEGLYERVIMTADHIQNTQKPAEPVAPEA